MQDDIRSKVDQGSRYFGALDSSPEYKKKYFFPFVLTSNSLFPQTIFYFPFIIKEKWFMDFGKQWTKQTSLKKLKFQRKKHSVNNHIKTYSIREEKALWRRNRQKEENINAEYRFLIESSGKSYLRIPERSKEPAMWEL